MPIRFKCQYCGKRLKTADGSEGKKTRCPQCEKLMRVPETSAPGRPSSRESPRRPPRAIAPLGLDDLLDPERPPAARPAPLRGDDLFDDSPSPIDSDADFAGVGDLLDNATYELGKKQEPAPRPAVNPFASSGVSSTLARGGGRRDGPAWERDGASPWSFFRTTVDAITGPGKFFSTMRRNDGMGAPFGYFFSGAIFVLAAGAALGFVVRSVFRPEQALAAQGPEPSMTSLVIGWTVLISIILVVLAVAPLITSWAMHLGVLMTGGSRFGLEATYRVVAYSLGSVLLLGLVPIVGPLVCIVANITLQITGLSRLHEFSNGRAVLVWFIGGVLNIIFSVVLIVAVVFVIGLIGVAVGLSREGRP